MTHEYLRAVQSYNLSYSDLKRMARQSLEHSFLPGKSLWSQTKLAFRLAPACAGGAAGADQLSSRCGKFLAANERARMQWKLEGEFAKFEKKY
jgi:adenosine deaminase